MNLRLRLILLACVWTLGVSTAFTEVLPKGVQIRTAKAKFTLYEVSNYSSACLPNTPSKQEPKVVCSFERMIPVKTWTSQHMPITNNESTISPFEFCTATVMNQAVKIRIYTGISYFEDSNGLVKKEFGAGIAFPGFPVGELLGPWSADKFNTPELTLNKVSFEVRTGIGGGGYTCTPSGPEFDGPVATYRVEVDIDDHLNEGK